MRPLGLFTLVLLAACSQPPAPTPAPAPTEPQPPDPEALRHFMDGQLYLNQGEYALAILEFQEALERDPQAGSIHVSMAEAYWKLGKVKRAEAHLKQALELDPGDIQALEILANHYVVRQQYDQAEAQFRYLVDVDPQNPDYLVALAELAKVRNDYAEAVQLYRQAFKVDPSQVDLLEIAAELALRTKQLEAASAIFENLVAVDARNEEYLQTYVDLLIMGERYLQGIQFLEQLNRERDYFAPRQVHLGILLYRQEEPARARSVFDSLDQREPKDATVLHYLATIHREQEDYQSAGEYADQMIHYFQDDPRGYVNRALLALNLEDPSQAVAVLDSVADRFQGDYSIQYLLGSSYQQIKTYDQAEKYFQRALSIYPQSRSAKHSLAILYDTLERWSESDRIYTELIASDSSDAQALNNYAYSLVERGLDLERALDMANQAIRLDPDNAAYMDTVGWIYFKLGQIDKALEYIRVSVKIEDSNAVVMEHLGDVLKAAHQTQQALDVYSQAYELDKTNERLKDKAFPE